MIWELIPDEYKILDEVFPKNETYSGTGEDTQRFPLGAKRKHSSKIVCTVDGLTYTYYEDLTLAPAGSPSEHQRVFSVEIDEYENETLVFTNAHSAYHDVPGLYADIEVAYLLGHLDGFLQLFDLIFLGVKRYVDTFTDLLDPDRCPEQFLNHFLNFVGWNLSAIDYDDPDVISVTTKRKLIGLAITVYKQKGTREGIVGLIRLMTGLESQVFGLWPEESWELGISENDLTDFVGLEFDEAANALQKVTSGGSEYASLGLATWATSGPENIETTDGETVEVFADSYYQGSEVCESVRSMRSIHGYDLPSVEITGFDSSGVKSGALTIRFTHTPYPDTAPGDWINTSRLRFEYSLNGGFTWHRATVTGTGVDPTKIGAFQSPHIFHSYDGNIGQESPADSGFFTNEGAVDLSLDDGGESTYHEVSWDTEAQGVALNGAEAGVKFRIVIIGDHTGWFGDGDSTDNFLVNNSDGPDQGSDVWDAEGISMFGGDPQRRRQFILGCSRLGSCRLGAPNEKSWAFHHFEVFVFATLTDLQRYQVCQIVSWCKPAWAHFTIIEDSETDAPDHWLLGTSHLGATTIF